MPDDLKHLNKDDLFLLMESYRNMITLHTTLVEQQKQLMVSQSNMIAKQDDIASQQNTICNKLGRVTEKLEECIVALSKTKDDVAGQCNSIDHNLDIMSKDLTTQHNGLSTKVYTSMGLMATIVISLITVIYSLADKYTLLEKMNGTLTQIANNLLLK
jgi:predicted PurR-regulated permease PerM